MAFCLESSIYKMNVDQIVSELDMQPHPEGGFFKETFRSTGTIGGTTNGDFPNGRHYATAIYYLLVSGDKSVFHRIKSDETWHHYYGGTLEIVELHADGKIHRIRLGKNILEGELLQYTVPAGVWFGARPIQEDTFVLAGCTVAPGFDFKDFEMADRQSLLSEFPDMQMVIEEYTK